MSKQRNKPKQANQQKKVLNPAQAQVEMRRQPAGQSLDQQRAGQSLDQQHAGQSLDQQHAGQSLDQRRAAFAWDKLKSLKSRDAVLFDAYTKLSKGAGTLIMQNGLMPTLAFYGHKSGGAASLAGGKEHEVLLAHLLTWLHQRQYLENSDFKSALDTLIRKSSAEYRATAEECLALIRWIRHFASALNKVE